MKISQGRGWLAVACCVGVTGCGGVGDEGELTGKATQASTCSGPEPKAVLVQNYTSGAMNRGYAQRNYRGVGQHQNSGCSGFFLGRGYYLSAGSCYYNVGDTVTVNGGAYTIEQIVAQKDQNDLDYALVKLQSSSELEVSSGMLRLGSRAPVAGEVIGALMANGPAHDGLPGNNGELRYFVSGSLKDLNASQPNHFRHRLDTPMPYGRGAPILGTDNLVIGMHTEDFCAGSTGYNEAMRIDKILADLPQGIREDLTLERPCTGTTVAGNTAWVGAGVTDVIKVTVNTAACGYTGTPLYFTSLAGTSGTEGAISTTAIYDRSQSSFRVNVQKAGITPALANSQGWRISWAAFPPGFDEDDHHYRCAGNTTSTNWQQLTGSTKVIYRDVTIPTTCTTVSPRNVFTSIVGDQEHRTAVGVNIIFRKTREANFRVYLYREAGITPTQASSWHWALNWLVSDENGSGQQEAAGESSGTWSNYSGGVKIGAQNNWGWDFEPLYFPSLIIQQDIPDFLPLTGTTSVNAPSKTGFTFSVGKSGLTASTVNGSSGNGWKMQWVAMP